MRLVVEAESEGFYANYTKTLAQCAEIMFLYFHSPPSARDEHASHHSIQKASAFLPAARRVVQPGQPGNPDPPSPVPAGRAQQDDPYADWALLRIEKGRAFINEKNLAMGKSLNALGSMKIELARTQAPAVIELSFGTPYGFMGAYLLSDYDELARSVLNAQHCALVGRDQAGELIRAGGNAVRRVYQLPTVWRRTDISVPQQAA